MPAISVYDLDQQGVVVDPMPLGDGAAGLTKAQNASPDPLGAKGAIRKRPGLKRVNASTTSTSIQGGVGIPLLIGQAGPSMINPISAPASIAQFTTPVLNVQGTITFDDESRVLDWDWQDDFDEEDSSGESGVGTDNEGGNEVVVSDDGDEFDVTDEQARGLGPVGTVFLARETADWFVSIDSTMVQHADNSTTYTDTSSLIFPKGSQRPQLGGFTVNVGSGSYTSTVNAYFSCVTPLGVFYATGTTDYTAGTTHPPIRLFNGYEDSIVARLPFNADISTTVPPTKITTLWSHGGTVYVATQDGGTVAGNDARGSVYSYNPQLHSFNKLGTTFAADILVTALCWYQGRLWAGTSSNNAPAKVYWFRPGIDSAWTLDTTFATDEAAVSGLTVFKGQVYASLLNRTITAGSGRVMKRTTLGVWSAVLTGTKDTNGAAHIGWRGFFGLCVWQPEDGSADSSSCLYVVRKLCTEDTYPALGILRSSDGASWTLVHSWDPGSDSTVGANGYFIPCMAQTTSSTAFVPMLILNSGRSVRTTVDGTTWPNTSTQVPAGFDNATTAPMHGLTLEL